ncbi:hypothetical protein NEFER03_2038 [Nematocida sp. LUAm3]|nr:hypothetical protein NEFER03_2038 [Nematocida sp. LUAm3]KAI5174512.1 hypothetical protein NEFER02_0633 [Nematocida sp. LUAm2]KAI5179163.1 hypothetical protein NEFER01_2026 [Nematocida sp. LUAm1]
MQNYRQSDENPMYEDIYEPNRHLDNGNTQSIDGQIYDVPPQDGSAHRNPISSNTARSIDNFESQRSLQRDRHPILPIIPERPAPPVPPFLPNDSTSSSSSSGYLRPLSQQKFHSNSNAIKRQSQKNTAQRHSQETSFSGIRRLEEEEARILSKRASNNAHSASLGYNSDSSSRYHHSGANSETVLLPHINTNRNSAVPPSTISIPWNYPSGHGSQSKLPGWLAGLKNTFFKKELLENTNIFIWLFLLNVWLISFCYIFNHVFTVLLIFYRYRRNQCDLFLTKTGGLQGEPQSILYAVYAVAMVFVLVIFSLITIKTVIDDETYASNTWKSIFAKMLPFIILSCITTIGIAVFVISYFTWPISNTTNTYNERWPLEIFGVMFNIISWVCLLFLSIFLGKRTTQGMKNARLALLLISVIMTTVLVVLFIVQILFINSADYTYMLDICKTTLRQRG